MKKDTKFDRIFEQRLRIFIGVLLVVFLVLVLRLWFLQVVSGDYYQALAEENRLKVEKINSLRGKIVDRNGRVLATNRLSYAVFVNKEITEDKNAFEALSRALETTTGVLLERIEREKFRLGEKILVAKDLSMEKVARIQEQKERYPNVTVSYLPVRSYPNDSLASHLLGYVGEVSKEELKSEDFKGVSSGDIVGKTGIERAYDSVLRGTKGQLVLEVDALGNVKRTIRKEEPIPGSNITLTIDANIQKASREALKKAISLAHSQGFKNSDAAAAVVLNVNTGEVLALASYPNYDPNLFVTGIDNETWKNLTSKKNNHPLLNRAVDASYSPGSTFKPLTLLSAFDNSLTYVSELFTCTGKWTGFGPSWPKYCWKRSGHGVIGLVEAISQSCDTVFYELGYRLYKEKGENLQKTTRKWGFGKKTGIVIGETTGRVPDKEWKKNYYEKEERKIWLPGDTVNLAIGQGDMLATPLQMARFYGAIANGGTLYRPQLVKKITSAEGVVLKELSPEVQKKIDFKESALRIIRTGLKKAVAEGTGESAFRGFPVEVAGKTGTSQVYGKDDFAWFVGYAPADKPKYVVAVMVEEGGHGGSVAAPAVRNIFSYLFEVTEKELVHSEDRSR